MATRGRRLNVHAYLGRLSDETIEAMLNELSIELGAAHGQERIYVAFADRTWILDAGEQRKFSPDLAIGRSSRRRKTTRQTK